MTLVFAQTKVFAYLKNDEGNPIEHATVILENPRKQVSVDKIGYFQFVDLPSGQYQLKISSQGYGIKILDFTINGEKRKDLGVVTLTQNTGSPEDGLAFIDLDDDENDGQTSTVGLLTSSQDVFSRIAAYDLGPFGFRPRGVDGRSSDYLLNGVAMKRPDNGQIDFGNWGGLNEITRYPEVSANHAPSEYTLGGKNSIFYKNTKPSEVKKGLQLTYSLANRNYRDRASIRYASGQNSKGWSFVLMGARRWAREGVQEGSFYDAFGTYFGIEKKFNTKHSLVFNFFGSPYLRTVSSPNTQEVYDYRGIHYSSYWGFQDGKKRNERVKSSFEPLFQLSDFWKINEKTSLWTNVSYQFGKEKYSRLDWQNTRNPSPQYYKNLPSYYQAQIEDILAKTPNADVSTLRTAYSQSLLEWQSGDPSVTQINWDFLYEQNLAQPIQTFNGISGKRALTFLVNDINNDKIFNASTHFEHNLNEHSKLLLNISYQNYRSELYQEVADLLGGDFALNKDPFAAVNHPESSGLYNEGEQNITKTQGDKITYDYLFNRNEIKINPALSFSSGRFNVLLSTEVGYNSSSRKGLFHHYLYRNSFGKSPTVDFWNYGVKGQAVYKINGKNFIVYNGAYFTESPYLEDIFVTPRTNSVVAPNLKNTLTTANDLSFIKNSPNLKLRLTAYWIDSKNKTQISRFYADGIQLGGTEDQPMSSDAGLLTQVLSDVHTRNIGGEVGIEVKLNNSFSAQGLASVGHYTYQNNPETYYASDFGGTDENKAYISLGKAYLKNYKQGNTAQQAFAVGIKYNSTKSYWLGLNWNYLGQNFIEPSAIIRTENFVKNPITGAIYNDLSESELRAQLAQTKLPSVYFFNANAGKSWRLGNYYVLLTASVNNILNTKKYITGGFEQTRLVSYPEFAKDRTREFPLFAPKLYYAQGRSFFLNLQLKF